VIIRQALFFGFILTISLVVPTVSWSIDEFSSDKKRVHQNGSMHSQSIKVSAWIKLDNFTDKWQWKGYGAGLLLVPKTRQVVFYIFDKKGNKRSIKSELNSFRFGVWQHVSGVFDVQSDIMELYVDDQGKPPYRQTVSFISSENFNPPSKKKNLLFHKVINTKIKARSKAIKKTIQAVKSKPSLRPKQLVKPIIQQAVHKRLNLPRRVRIMPLGDSITSSNAYRHLLWKKLQSAGYQVDFIGTAKDIGVNYDTDHEGHSGWEAGEIEAKISGWLNHNTPDIVMLHIGTNDLTHGQSNASTLSEINGIIERIRRKNNSVIILLAKIIPIRHLDTSAFNHQLGRFAEQRSTQASPVIVVDQASGYDAVTDSIDGIHPNNKGERKIANKWFGALRRLLSKEGMPSVRTTY